MDADKIGLLMMEWREASNLIAALTDEEFRLSARLTAIANEIDQLRVKETEAWRAVVAAREERIKNL